MIAIEEFAEIDSPPEGLRRTASPTRALSSMAGKDAVILKAIAASSLDKFDELMVEARRQARRAGLKQADVRRVIAQARGHG